MEYDLIGLFDPRARLRAIMRWVDDVYLLETVPGFDDADIKEFLLWLAANEPSRRLEKNGVTSMTKTSKDDPLYRNAVMQELDAQGFLAYPIKEYQKNLLAVLGDKKFDTVRQVMLGDLLALSEDATAQFLKDLKEGVDILEEIHALKAVNDQ